MVTRNRMLFAGLALAALAAQGCGGPDFDALCEEQEGCFGGNEKDVEACVISAEAQADAADAIGCSDEFDAYYECIGENASCRSESSGFACTTDPECDFGDFQGVCTGGECQFKVYGFDPQLENNPCEAEENAFERCN